MRDRVREFFSEKTARRGLLLALFVGGLAVFWKLLPLLAFFVSFERGLHFSAGVLNRRFKWSRGAALGVVLTLCAVVVVLLAWLSAGKLARVVVEARDTLPERMAALREHPWYLELKEKLPDSEKLAQSAEHYAGRVAKSAATLGHLVLLGIIGFILAIIFFLDEKAVQAFRERLPEATLSGTLARWFEHLAEAISLTVQLQLVVALSNTVLTLPVLLLLGVPHVPALMVLIFVSGLIPVVGNLLAGSVLVVLSYQAKGWLGVGLFVGLTFVLHKIEAYYLNPRLTARHVPLPGFVLVVSLICFEHLFGFVGLFLSFPFLYVAGKIRAEFAEEDARDKLPTPDRL
ncbi:MAG: AI-2E family transporter [Archangiaceae bacterium]|nr:AI-2E family transporter [Archangiaceae bacterium]